jgi:hypothetical protein
MRGQRPSSVCDQLSRRGLLGAAAATALVPLAAAAATAEAATLHGSDGREIPLSIWRATGRKAGVIAFSHGALSAPWKYPDMVQAWTAAGYEVLAPLHVDSTDHPRHGDFPGLANWKARIEDMRAVAQRIGGRYIAAGHSYGAFTALTLGGASGRTPDGVSGALRDPNAVCAVAFSPPAPMPALFEPAGYASLAVPALIETGTRDIPPGAAAPDGWRGHYTAYDVAAAGGHRYGLVLGGVDHYFGGLICDSNKLGPPQAEQLKRAIQLSLLFMAAWGPSGSSAARRRLDSLVGADGPVRLASK